MLQYLLDVNKGRLTLKSNLKFIPVVIKLFLQIFLVLKKQGFFKKILTCFFRSNNNSRFSLAVDSGETAPYSDGIVSVRLQPL